MLNTYMLKAHAETSRPCALIWTHPTPSQEG